MQVFDVHIGQRNRQEVLMKEKRFVIRLHTAHDGSLSPYAVAQKLNISENTARKYMEEEIVSKTLRLAVIHMAELFGVDWKDSHIVKVIEVEEPDESGQKKTPLAATA
jgi:sugar diacid utilization regulator